MGRPARLRAALWGLAVAFIAAAIGDPLVEAMSNAGLFGPGFSDDDHQSVVPVLMFGMTLALVLMVRLVMRALRSAERNAVSPHRSMRLVVAALATTTSPRTIAFAFCMQLAVVNAMERCEHAWAGGAAVQGFSWLGAPPLFALLAHLIVLLGCAYVARRASRALLATAAAALGAAFERVIAARARAQARPLGRRVLEPTLRRYELVAVRALRGRAPPPVPAFA